MKFLFFVFSLFLFIDTFAQHDGNIWYFGSNAGLDFNGPAPVALNDGALLTLEGCASAADPATGSLLLYTDGTTVWDRNHNPMPGSLTTPLKGGASSSQSSVIVPQPGNPNIYYIFTTPAMAGAPPNLPHKAMCYSIVDLNLNGGNGDVTTVNTEIMDVSTEKIAVVGNCTQSAFWIVGHKWNSDSFYAFRLTEWGLSAPVKSKTGIVHETTALSPIENGETMGCMKFSSNGRKLGVVTFMRSKTVQIFDFNFKTGVVSNPVTDVINSKPMEIEDLPYGCSFSPDNARFYVSCVGTMNTIFQYNMELATHEAILASRTVVASKAYSNSFCALQNGPDGKMYIAVGGTHTLAVMNNPNGLGSACGYVANGVNLAPGAAQSGLPNIVESFLSPPVPAIFNMPEKNVICNGDTLFAEQFMGDNFSITPNTGFSVSQDRTMVSFFPTATTSYTVVAKGGACGGAGDTVRFTIYISEAPKADFVFDPENPVLVDKTIHLINKSVRAHNYAWYDANGQLESINKDHQVIIDGEGEICYTLVASDTFNCTDTVEKCVIVNSGVEGSVVELPNAFSPNGDGLNDEFRFSGYNVRLNNFSIFNRYGERVFFTTDKSVGWDGRFKGNPCDVGTYFYMIRYEDKFNKKELIKGSVLLIR